MAKLRQPEKFAFRNADLYLHLPNGTARTKVAAYLGRELDVCFTLRSWKTVRKLADLAATT